MRRLSAQRVFSLIIAAVLLAGGCVSTDIRLKQKEKGFQPALLRRVMVFGMFTDPEVRKMFEDACVQQFTDRGVTALSSLDSLPASVPLEKNRVLPYIRHEECDAVLVARLVEKSTVKPTEPAEPFDIQKTTAAAPNKQPSTKDVLFAPPVYATAYERVIVEINLVEMSSGRPMWSAMSETKVFSRDLKHIEAYAVQLFRKMYGKK